MLPLLSRVNNPKAFQRSGWENTVNYVVDYFQETVLYNLRLILIACFIVVNTNSLQLLF